MDRVGSEDAPPGRRLGVLGMRFVAYLALILVFLALIGFDVVMILGVLVAIALETPFQRPGLWSRIRQKNVGQPRTEDERPSKLAVLVFGFAVLLFLVLISVVLYDVAPHVLG